MEDPNLIYHTRDGKVVRECRTCANARYRANRKAKKRNAALLAGMPKIDQLS